MQLAPQLHWPTRNTRCMTVAWCDMELYYSYETLVGAAIPGEGTFQTEEKYSNTTSRHKSKDLNIAWCQKIPHKVLVQKVNEHALLCFQHRLLSKFVGEF